MATDNDFPQINGTKHSWAEMQNVFCIYNGPIIRVADITAISFSATLEPGKVRGKGIGLRGATAGQFDTEGSMTLLLQAAMDFVKSLETVARRLKCTPLEVPFSLGVSWKAKLGSPLMKVALIGCRVTKLSSDESPSTDASEVEMPLYFPEMTWNGVSLSRVPK